MSTATLAPPPRAAHPLPKPAAAPPVLNLDPQDVEALRYRFSREDYHRMSEAGMLQDRRTRLIDGYILAMPAVKVPHTFGTNLSVEALEGIFGKRDFWVRKEDPLVLGAHEPEPDVAVVAGGMKSWRNRPQPTTALLVVEVAETSLRLDRWTQAGLYASFGIADYWILNLVDRVLEVHRDPVPDAYWPFGHRYANVRVLDAAATVSPLAMPSASVAVADLLP